MNVCDNQTNDLAYTDAYNIAHHVTSQLVRSYIVHSNCLFFLSKHKRGVIHRSSQQQQQWMLACRKLQWGTHTHTLPQWPSLSSPTNPLCCPPRTLHPSDWRAITYLYTTAHVLKAKRRVPILQHPFSLCPTLGQASARRGHREDYHRKWNSWNLHHRITAERRGPEPSNLFLFVEKGCSATLLLVACGLLASLEKEERDVSEIDLPVAEDKCSN